MEDSRSLLQKQQMREAEARRAAAELQEAKLKALQNTLSNYGDFRYIDLEDFIDPNNQNWTDYAFYEPKPDTYLFGPPTRGHVNAGTPVGMLIQHIRDAKNIDDVKKQLGIWNTYKPLDSSDNGTNYLRYFLGPRFAAHLNTPSNESNPGQTGNTGGTQGVVTVGSTQGTQGAVAGSGTQGVQGAQAGNTGGGAASTQGAQVGAQTGGTGGTTGNGTYASSGVPKGGTKTIGYDPYNPNPGNVSLAYARSGSTYASPGINTGGTYATGEGIKDANGNVLTNPGGNWEYKMALRDPSYGVLMRDRMSDAQKKYWQAVSHNMGFNYDL